MRLQLTDNWPESSCRQPHRWLTAGVLIICLCTHTMTFGQKTNQIDEKDAISKDESFSTPRDTKKEIDINFLFNYYDQDGKHSAVTGGQGTEELNDRAMKIVVNVPLDSVSTLNFGTHLNVYTSASTDRIDSNVSSASRHDLRNQFDVGYTREIPAGKQQYGLNFGGSSESDYISIYGGGRWSKNFNNNNSQIGLSFQAFFDTWLLIFPEELRTPQATAFIETNRRKSFNLSVTLAQVLHKKLQAAVFGDVVYQTGLLSTPFHRVYFNVGDSLRIEKLPSRRFKFPVGVRINYFSTDHLIFRFYYRFYYDNFGINAHTLSLEAPLKVNSFFSIYPFYRYHRQTASKYFKPFKEHSLQQTYYTSDFDLSGFDSHKVGLGLHFAPIWGIGRFKLFSKTKITRFKSIDLRYAWYSRSDGLSASVISGGFAFTSK